MVSNWESEEIPCLFCEDATPISRTLGLQARSGSSEDLGNIIEYNGHIGASKEATLNCQGIPKMTWGPWGSWMSCCNWCNWYKLRVVGMFFWVRWIISLYSGNSWRRKAPSEKKDSEDSCWIVKFFFQCLNHFKRISRSSVAGMLFWTWQYNATDYI